MADLEITFNTVNLPANTSGTLTVREDVGDDGTIDNTNSTSLSDGVTSYTLSGFDGSSGNAIEPEVSLDNSDDVSTATVSEPTDITVSGPTTPTLSLDATRDTEIDLSWTDESADSYNVYRAQSSGSTTADYTLVAEPAGTTTTYTDTGLENGERYYYRVTSEASDGTESSLSNEVDGTTTLPAPSLSLDASVEDEITVNYTFNDNSSDGDLVLERSQDGGSTWTTVATITTLSNGSYTDSGLADGVTFTYRGTRNTDHASTQSGTPSATTILPAATNLSASDVRTTEVDLSWTVNADNGTQDVEYKESSASTWQTFSSGLALSTSTETVTGLSAGTQYDFRVDTVTQDTNSLSGTFTTTTVPPAPTGLTVSEVTDTPDVALSWTDVSGEDNYNIYRATSPGSTLADYTQVDSVTSNTTTYTDTGVSLGTRYYYRVSAENANGESSGSNEVRAEPNSDDLTESIAWDVNREWNYGTFTSNTTTVSGSVSLTELSGTIDIDYTLNAFRDTTGSIAAYVEVRDQSSGTTIASDSAQDEDKTGTFTINIDDHPDIEYYARVDDNNTDYGGEASMVDYTGETVISVTTGVSETADITDTSLYNYTYEKSGAYRTETWDYTNTTTATEITASASLPAANDSITVTVETPAGDTSGSVSLADGATSAFVEVPASDQYYVSVDVDRANNSSQSPTLDSLTLEAHTPTANHAVVDTRNTEVDLSWDEVSVSDGYEVYYSTSTPVTDSDTLGFDTTNPSTTTATITGLSQGTTYYFNVRTQYSGE